MVREVVRACGYLPLAIRIAAARLSHRPKWTVAVSGRAAPGRGPAAGLPLRRGSERHGRVRPVLPAASGRPATAVPPAGALPGPRSGSIPRGRALRADPAGRRAAPGRPGRGAPGAAGGLRPVPAARPGAPVRPPDRGAGRVGGGVRRGHDRAARLLPARRPPGQHADGPRSAAERARGRIGAWSRQSEEARPATAGLEPCVAAPLECQPAAALPSPCRLIGARAAGRLRGRAALVGGRAGRRGRRDRAGPATTARRGTRSN